MTEDVFLKHSYRPYQIMNFIHNEKIIECMVISIDFDERLFKLQSIETYEITGAEFWVRCEHCELPRKKLHIKK
jgi:hypothetical protein